MIKKLFRYLRYRKMKKKSASFILNDFAEIINDTIDHFERQGKIKSPLYKEGLEFESTAFLF